MVRRVTFVCTGNICRSPIAEVVLADALRTERVTDVVVDSSGTGDWHVGERADPRAVAALARVGLDGSRHRARMLDADDLADVDLLLALDAGHRRALAALGSDPARIRLVRSFDPAAPAHALDVADPYYGDDADFDRVVAQVRAAVPGLVAHLRSPA